MLLILATLSQPARADGLAWRAALGAQLDSDSHGMADVGLRRDRWSLELLTDTVDLRYAPSDEHGRAWVALRLEAVATGLFISPWTDGAPDPGRALFSHAVGMQAGALHYLPHGWYIGASGQVRYQFFGATATTAVVVPRGRPISTADGVVGWWSAHTSAWARAGADAWLEPTRQDQPRAAPHLAAQARWEPAGVVAPVVGVWAGVAHGQDPITRTRLGGLNPYVVPLAGAAWAEWRVEDYAALRAGARLTATLERVGEVSVMPFADTAVAPEIDRTHADGPWAVGFGLWGRWQHGRASLDLAGGYAPWISRHKGVSRVSAYLRAEVDWGTGARLWHPESPP